MIDRLKYMKNKPSLTGERGRYVFDGTQKKKNASHRTKATD
jgi:hypothetical protein